MAGAGPARAAGRARDPRPLPPPPALPVPALAGAFGVVLLVVGLGVGLAINNGGGDGGGEDIVVTLEPVTNADAGAEGRADLNERDGVAEVAVKGLAPTAAGETYELWLLNSPEELVSLGRFSVPDTGDTDVRVSLPASAPEFRYLDISREPPDGNPGHSGVSVLRAEV